MVSYGGKTIPRWRTAAILKIDISPHFSEKLPDFHEILYTSADFELDEHHVIKNEKKLHWTDSEFDRTYFLFLYKSSFVHQLAWKYLSPSVQSSNRMNTNYIYNYKNMRDNRRKIMHNKLQPKPTSGFVA